MRKARVVGRFASGQALADDLGARLLGRHLAMIGPGKYDAELTEIRERIKARGAILIVIDGERGGGFSAQLPLDVTLRMPEMLRHIADEIERSGPTS